MMKNYLFLLFILIGYSPSFGQEAFRDSLLSLASATSDDSTRYHYFGKLTERYLKNDLVWSKAFLDSMQTCQFAQQPKGASIILYLEGMILRQERKNEEAMAKLNEALPIFQEINLSNYIGMTFTAIGGLHLVKGDHSTANEYFQKAANHYTVQGDSLGLALAFINLGVVQRRMGNLDAAYKNYKEAMPVLKRFNDLNNYATTLLNLAIIDKQKGNFDKSLQLYQEALDIAYKLEPVDQGLLAYVFGNMSALYHEQNEYEKAIEYGERSLEIRRKSASSEELANSLIGLAANAERIHQLTKAENYLNEAQEHAGSNNAQLYQIWQIKGNILQKRKEFEEALRALRQANVYRDSLYNAETARQISELNAKFDSERKENEIAQLKIREELSKVELSRRTNMIFALLAGLALLVLFFVILFRNNQKIKQQNGIIQRTLRDKETLLKEIHHRVKNNLQVISSLLRIQSLSIRDEKAKEAILEGRSRVRSMALIHEDLYQEDNLSSVEMQSYLDKLAKDIFRVYNVREGGIQLQTDIDPIKLDVESVIPIGLITNELITNALKYAFPDQKNGTIILRLKEHQEQLLLAIEDNGIGLTEPASDNSFGFTMIDTFKDKLEADLQIQSVQGTQVTLRISNFRKAG